VTGTRNRRQVGVKVTPTPACPAPTPEAIEVCGQVLTPGTMVSISGSRGRFRYIRSTTTSEGKTVLDFIGGTSGHDVWRSFYPERVRRVHNTPVRRPKR
jgi:hypothetical protein